MSRHRWGAVVVLVTVGLGLASALATAEDDRAVGKRVFTDQGCHGCHMVGAMGTPVATDLTRIGARRTRDELTRWLADPASQKPTAHMPKLALSPAEIRALAAYLASLR